MKTKVNGDCDFQMKINLSELFQVIDNNDKTVIIHYLTGENLIVSCVSEIVRMILEN